MLENKLRLPYANFQELIEVPFYVENDVSGGKLFLLLSNTGYRYLPLAAVYYDPNDCANTVDSLMAEAFDCCRAIPTEDLYQAYGYDTEEQYQAAVNCESPELPELAEGYYYQNDSTGTGIIELGQDWMYHADFDIVRETRLHRGLPVHN